MQGPPWRWGWRRRGRGRPPKPRRLARGYGPLVYRPVDPSAGPLDDGEPVVVGPDELEALRLVYLEKMSQEEAARAMGVSRGTLWRLIDSGRRKIIRALVEGRPIVVAGYMGLEGEG